MFMVFMHRQNGFLPFTFQYFTTDFKTDGDVITVSDTDLTQVLGQVKKSIAKDHETSDLKRTKRPKELSEIYQQNKLLFSPVSVNSK